tara:strand:+ start:13454 stop:13720 length:267 start_codon:yes stop_codon:yes gene_type:complete
MSKPRPSNAPKLPTKIITTGNTKRNTNVVDYKEITKFVNNFGMDAILVELCELVKKRNTSGEKYLNQLYSDLFNTLENYRKRYDEDTP